MPNSSWTRTRRRFYCRPDRHPDCRSQCRISRSRDFLTFRPNYFHKVFFFRMVQALPLHRDSCLLVACCGTWEAGFDWSYSDQAQYDVIAKKGWNWSRTGIGTREVPATGPAAFSRLPQRQQPSTSGQNIQDIPYFPQRFACHALLSRSMTVRAHLVSLYIEFAAVSIYCYAF